MSRSFILPVVALSGLAVAAEPWDSWKPGVPWQVVSREPVDLSAAPPFVPAKAVVWDVDLFLTSAADIAKFKANNKIVICHVSAGSVNSYDPDYENFGGSLGNVAGYDVEEHYVDIADSAVTDFMKSRISLAAQNGCDGVDLDHVDAWFDEAIGIDYSGFNLTADNYISLLTTLASHAHSLKTTVHSRPLLVGQRNAPDLAYDLYETLDFAVLESCLGLPEDVGLFDDEFYFSFCDIFEDAFVGTGKPVFQIEFPDSVAADGGKLSQEDYQFYCGADGNGIAGFSEVLKRWETDVAGSEGWVQYCGAGPDGEVYQTPTLPIEYEEEEEDEEDEE